MDAARENTGFRMPPKLDADSATERLQIVATRRWVERIDEWRRKQDRIPNKSEAIRMLVEKALDADGEYLKASPPTLPAKAEK